MARPRSVVEDPDGPTPVLEQAPVEMVDPNDIPGLREVSDPSELPHPIPYQPWRRGDTAGCEAPINADWRRAAEEEIKKAVAFVGGRVLDVTWYLTTVLVTIDEEKMPIHDFTKDRGPQIDIIQPAPPVFYDPADPNPEPIWADDDDVMYVRETEEEAAEAAERKHNMYANISKFDGEDPNEPHNPDVAGETDDIGLYSDVETRAEVADLLITEERDRQEQAQKPMDMDTIDIDTAALSTIAQAILDALEPHEEEWQILSRHELLLSSPNPAADVLETQSQFDAYREHHVAVETLDPFQSNRTLKGQLVDRNAMDLILNIQGRMVTVPLNFVKCVRLPPGHEIFEPIVMKENEDDEFVTPLIPSLF